MSFTKRYQWKPILAVILLLLVSLSWPVKAQQPTGNGMRVSPPRYEFSIMPGASKTFDITIGNITSGPLIAYATVNNFIVEDEAATPVLNIDPNFDPPYGLTRYVSGLENLPLQPGEEKTIHATVTIPADAAPGSYYGLVRFSTVQPETTEPSTVALSASVGTILLVTVPGDVIEAMNLVSLSAASDSGRISPFFSNPPTVGVVRIENTGNVFEKPFGKITITNWSGDVVYEYELNNTDPRGNVLPGTTRRFEDPIQNIGRFGRFTIEANISYGEGGGQIITASSSFWVIPWPLIVAAILVLVALWYGIRKGIPAYNRRVIQRARR
jgi:hypothetical protein